MDRYTMDLTDGQVAMNCQICPASWNQVAGSGCTALYCRNRLKNQLAHYEGILNDVSDFNKLREMVEIIKNLPHICDLCIGCEVEPQDGHGCDGYDAFVFSPKRLYDLIERSVNKADE